MDMKRILLLLLFAAVFAIGVWPAVAVVPEPAGLLADSLEAQPVVVSALRSPEVPTVQSAGSSQKQRFLPVRRRMDREIDKVKYVYKGEMMMGLTASYGTLSSDDTDFLVILDNINANGTIATVKPYFGYFYRDNRCFGVRFGYTYVDATLNSGARFDLGEGNDVAFDIPYVGAKSNNYSFGIFHRSYAGLDPKGRFGLFAEVELSMSSGKSEFAFETGGDIRTTYSENIQAKFSFNPGRPFTSSRTFARRFRSAWAVSSIRMSRRRTPKATKSVRVRHRTCASGSIWPPSTSV